MIQHSRTLVAVLAVVAMATGLAGCGTDSGALVETNEIPSGDAMTMPEGSIEAAVEQLPELVRETQDTFGIPGIAVAVVHDGKKVFAEGYGVKKSGGSDEVGADTVFQVASVSKAVGATVVASQVSQGLVAWDTPVTKHLDGFELADPWVTSHVTIGDFYSHRSGLPATAGDKLEDVGYDRDYILNHLKYQQLNDFRSSYGYANFGTTTGAETVARAAGTEWETLAAQQLFEPLDMSSTSFRYDDFLEEQNRAVLHAKVDGTFQPLYKRDADPQSPAGGLSSNVNDMSKWMQLILAQGTFDGEPLIKPEALLPATSAQSITDPVHDVTLRPGLYGYGVGVGVQPSGRVQLSHSGAFALGAATNFTLLPSADVGIIILTNAGPVGGAEALAAKFTDLVQFGETTRDWDETYGQAMAPLYAPAGDLADKKRPASPADPNPLSEYAGTYHNDYFGPATVRVDDDRLIVELGPGGGYQVELSEWHGNTFAFVPTGENAPDGSLSSATFGGSGAASTLTLEFFDAEKLGTWTR